MKSIYSETKISFMSKYKRIVMRMESVEME